VKSKAKSRLEKSNVKEEASPTPFLVVNIETTCDLNQRLDPQEVIELSVVALDPNTLSTIADFQRFVRPEVHPELSPFCVAETGIGQAYIDQSEVLEDVLEELSQWVEELTANSELIQVFSFTHSQLQVLKQQAQDEELDLPIWLETWVNLCATFKKHFQIKGFQTLDKALAYLGTTTDESGEPEHTGLAKAHNATKLLIDLIKLDARMEAVSEQDSYKSDKPAVQEKPGDWRCDRCNFLNFARRNFCKDCGATKPGFTPSQNQRNGQFSQGEGRPGDWKCERCNFNNFARRNFCKDCGASRPGGAPQRNGGGYGGGYGGEGYGGGGYGGRGQQRGQRGPRMKPGDWRCPDCSFVNFARRNSCKDCGCDRPERELGGNSGRPGDWNCTSCSYHNFAYREECGQCGGPKTEA
jgi:inhibitor of KinA sporulation pathway (predicted exonuclease)